MNFIKRLLLIIPHLSDGGSQRVVSIWASTLAEQSIDIDLVQFYCGINEYRLSPKVTVHILSSGDALDYKNQGIYEKLSRLRAVIKSISPDAIITFLGTTGPKALLSTLGLGIPVFTTIQSNPMYASLSSYSLWLRNISILFSRGCLVQTEAQRYYLPFWVRHKTKVLPNPVSSELYTIHKSYDNTYKTIVAAGRLVREKNYPLLINAFANAHKKYSYLQLHIYGEGELRSALQGIIDQLSLNSSVLLKGRSNTLWKEFCQADLFVLSSESEGMPNVLMEAMAIGLPCISTDCPTGPAELIKHGWNGLLVPNQDEAELTKAILNMVENPGVGNEMGIRARQEVLERYNISENVAELVSYLQSFL